MWRGVLHWGGCFCLLVDSDPCGHCPATRQSCFCLISAGHCLVSFVLETAVLAAEALCFLLGLLCLATRLLGSGLELCDLVLQAAAVLLFLLEMDLHLLDLALSGAVGLGQLA